MKVVKNNRESIISPEQTRALDEACAVIDKIFPVDGPLSVAVVICNNNYEADVVTRLVCTHCLWKLFDNLANDYFAQCVEEGLVKELSPETRH